MANSVTRLATIAVISLVAIYLGFIAFTPTQSESLFRSIGYWNVLGLIVLFAIALFKDSSNALKDWIQNKSSLVLILLSVGLAFFLYTREGGGFKILFDEHVLANVSKSLYYGFDPVVKESSLILKAEYAEIDKRPLLFPFLVSILHHVSGYRVENAFYLNFALTALFLGLLYSTVNRLSNRTAGIYAVVLACCSPLISQNSSGGGFEMLNLCFILIVTWFAIDYWISPSAKTLNRMILATALASHIRYESSLIILPVGSIILASWIVRKQLILSPILFILPLSFLPLAWQLNYVKSIPSYWQYSLSDESSFDLSYIPINLKHAFNFLAIPNSATPSSPIVGIVGTVSLIALCLFSMTRWKQFFKGRPDRISALIMAAAPVGQLVIVLSFTYGQLDDAIVSRLGLPFILLSLACGGIALGHIHSLHKKLRIVTIGIVAGASIYAMHAYSLNNYSNLNALSVRSKWILQFADSLPKNETNLFISNMPRIFEVENYSNLSIPFANNRVENLKTHFELKTYKNVFVIQEGKFDWDEGVAGQELLHFAYLDPRIHLETVNETSFIPHNFIRISRVTGIDTEILNENLSERGKNIDESEKIHFKTLTPEEYAQWFRSLP